MSNVLPMLPLLLAFPLFPWDWFDGCGGGGGGSKRWTPTPTASATATASPTATLTATRAPTATASRVPPIVSPTVAASPTPTTAPDPPRREAAGMVIQRGREEGHRGLRVSRLLKEDFRSPFECLPMNRSRAGETPAPQGLHPEVVVQPSRLHSLWFIGPT